MADLIIVLIAIGSICMALCIGHAMFYILKIASKYDANRNRNRRADKKGNAGK
jgi:hypothetical protein